MSNSLILVYLNFGSVAICSHRIAFLSFILHVSQWIVYSLFNAGRVYLRIFPKLEFCTDRAFKAIVNVSFQLTRQIRKLELVFKILFPKACTDCIWLIEFCIVRTWNKSLFLIHISPLLVGWLSPSWQPDADTAPFPFICLCFLITVVRFSCSQSVDHNTPTSFFTRQHDANMNHGHQNSSIFKSSKVP